LSESAATRLLGGSIIAALALTFVLAAGPAMGQTSIKIGFIATFTGPVAAVGNHMRNGFELALDHLGRKMGGLPIEVIYEDDQQKPEVGKQKTEKLVQSDRVHIIAGYQWSNVLLASLKSAVDSQTFVVGANAGPSQIGGELCSPFFFSTSWQNDQPPMAVGEYLKRKGVRTLFLLAPNYAAGRDILSGVKATYDGQIIGEEYTKWPDQLDFSAELSKARASRPEAVFAFYPGGVGVQFLNQYAQSGLKGQIPLYTVFTIDETTLPLQKDVALDVPGVQEWVNDLPNPANRKFVADFRARYGNGPSIYAAQAYDAANLINSAVVAVKGNLADKDGMRNEMRRANYDSVRGPYKYGNNHFPIQNFYLHETVKNADGTYGLRTVEAIVKDGQDRFHDKCPMKW